MNHDVLPIRVTPTYAGPDSKGIVSILGWELEGLVAFYLVAGGVAGLAVVFALARCDVFTRLIVGTVPVALAAGWVRGFVYGRPPGYQSDVLERWWRGQGFGLLPQGWCRKRDPRAVLLARIQGEETHG